MINLKDRSFYLTVLAIALPIAIQQVATSAGGLIDNLMVGVIGTKAIGAVGSVNKFINIFWFLIYGFTSGGATFITQFQARDDSKGIQRVIGVTLIFNLIIAFIFTYISIFHGHKVANMFSTDPEIVKMALSYLRVMTFIFIFSAISYAYAYPLRTIGKAKLAMYIILFSQVVNIFLNNLLISGKWGFPAMGVAGAALATVIGKIVEMSLMLFFVYYNKYIIAGTWRTMSGFTYRFLGRYLQIAAPLGVNELFLASGFLVYQLIIGRVSVDAMGAYTMIAPFESLLVNIFVGLGNAAMVMIGSELGKNNTEEAYNTAKKFSIMSPAIAGVLGVIVIIFAKNIVSVYSLMGSGNISENSLTQAAYFLRILGFFLFIRVYNLVSFAGILKSGGDVKFILWVETCTLWGIGVPLTFLASKVFISQPYLIYLTLYIEEITKGYFISKRFKSKKWIRNLIDIE